MRNSASKRVISALLALILVLALACPAFAAESEQGVVLKLHYHRPDGDYTDWSVWFWNVGAEGVDIPFAEENGEQVATFPVKPGVTSVGYIVKLPGWAAKDVNKDQFIDVAAYVSGTVHVYVESGVEGHTVVLGDDVVTGIKVISCAYEEGLGIRVEMTAGIETPSEAFKVMGPEGEIAISSISSNDKSHVIFTEEKLDLLKSYTLIYDEEEYNIIMPNIYSTKSFEENYTYHGSDLGATWSAEKTAFRVWAPTAEQVKVNLYKSGTQGTDDLLEALDMTPDANGTWVAEKAGDLNGTYYTYSVLIQGIWTEACDPYARTTGVNGKRAMVIDLDSTDPEGWDTDTDPHAGKSFTDAVIYELHVRDLSVDESSGITNKGKYLGLIETGTTNGNGIPTGLDHIKDLGVTHIHLLPIYDYGSVDESKLDTPQFNWGYDPVNYNVPEGSYSTDPYNGAVRVAELKQTVKGLHDNGISVIMDVVYNHVYSAGDYCFNKIVPGYFSRISDTGSYSNGSGCGNDTASERSMVKKYIVDSVKYWADEYHIDGFRFDLVGLIDTETMNAIIEEVHKTHPNVVFYGEGWTMSTNVTKEGYTLATQVNSKQTPGLAFFSDTIRDALKGTVFNNDATGYVSGSGSYDVTIGKCFRALNNWSSNPLQIINYASCHDNMSLFDRLTQSTPEASVEDRIRMNNLAAAIYLTSQGVPFMQAGEEMLRSKPLADGSFDHNSYSSPDSVNSLKWDNLNQESYQQVYSYYKGLIAFRAAHPALRMTSAEEIAAHITPVSGLSDRLLAFHITAGAGGEEHDLFVVFNASPENMTVTLPEGKWTVYVNGEHAGTEPLKNVQGKLTVEGITAMVLVQDGVEAPAEPMNVGLIAGIAAAAAAAVAATAVVLKKRKK